MSSPVKRVKPLNRKAQDRDKPQQRARRSAYSSGRKEVIGYEGNPMKRQTRVVAAKPFGATGLPKPLKAKPWRIY